jgi:hypothetical protein
MRVRDKIFTYIVNSNRINDSINNIVDDKKYLEDFKQHFYLQMLEMDENKIIRAYIDGYLDWLCIRVMLNQWRSKTSSFYYQYRDTNVSYQDDLKDVKDEKSSDIQFDYKQAECYIRDRNEKWLDKQYHLTLFKLYFDEGHNYRQISEMTGININSVAQSINKSLDYIKKKIK